MAKMQEYEGGEITKSKRKVKATYNIYDRPSQNVEIFDVDLFSVIYTAL